MDLTFGATDVGGGSSPVAADGLASIGGVVTMDPNASSADHWFQVINQSALNWYQTITNHPNPNSGGVTITTPSTRAALSGTTLLLVAGIAALVLLRK